jgi:hypothetical protein
MNEGWHLELMAKPQYIIGRQILVMSNWNWYMGDFFKSFIWSSMDHSKDNFRNNFLDFKPNYFNSFLIITSLFFPTNMDMKKQINMCLFMSMKCILV